MRLDRSCLAIVIIHEFFISCSGSFPHFHQLVISNPV
nr:MAG TPA: hypothetical protein [Caudoviricetes sp.]